MMGSTESDSVLRLFRRACHRHPDNTAVDSGLKRTLSYRQLDQQSTKLAVQLRENGIEMGQVIPLLTGSRLEMVIAVLGILKAGGVYVPVDIDQWPPERVSYVLNRTNSGLVVYTGTELPSQVNVPGNCRVIQVHIQSSASFEQISLGTKHDTVSCPRLMCIIFTSGTTDKPKGVKIPHSSVAQFVTSPGFNYNIKRGDRVLLVLSVAFDGRFNQPTSLSQTI